MIYIDYDEVEAIAIIIIALPLFDIIEDHLAQAWDKVNYNVVKEIADSADTENKGSGKGKTIQWTRNNHTFYKIFHGNFASPKRIANITRSVSRKRSLEEEEEDSRRTGWTIDAKFAPRGRLYYCYRTVETPKHAFTGRRY